MKFAFLAAAVSGQSQLLSSDEIPIVDYFEIDNTWYIQDDQVMGGSSQSYIDDNNRYMSFYGNIVAEDGGFCLTRTEDFSNNLDLEDYDGITLTVRSKDHQIYKFGLQDDNYLYGRWESIDWQAKFEVSGGFEWQQVFIPFEDFVGTFRGITIEERILDLNQITQFHIMYSKFDTITGFYSNYTLNPLFEEGEFILDFKDIGAYY